ncbi:MAG: hypothetical protein ABL977_07230 [Candidatus Eisenbacteria bacterium]
MLSCPLLAPAAHAVSREDAHGTYALIVSNDVDVSNLTSKEVGRLLLGQRRFWRSGQAVIVLLPGSGSPARHFLLDHVFHMNEATYRRLVLGLLYRGELEYAPKAVVSDQEALAFVAAGHGAVALVPAELVTSASARVVHVDGHLPGETGYPLAH